MPTSGRWMRDAPIGTWLRRPAAVAVFFEFLELRHKVEIHAVTGMVLACPIDEMNRPRGSKPARLRVPPREAEMEVLFARWAADLASCRKFAPSARNYAAARLMAEAGLRVNEARSLDLADVHWDLAVLQASTEALRSASTIRRAIFEASSCPASAPWRQDHRCVGWRQHEEQSETGIGARRAHARCGIPCVPPARAGTRHSPRAAMRELHRCGACHSGVPDGSPCTRPALIPPSAIPVIERVEKSCRS
jgi:hypothetical protein